MKALQIAQDILPIGEFKSQTARVIRSLRESGRPMVVTQNGRPAAVLLAPEVFDELMSHHRFISAVQAGLADSDAGNVIDDAELDEVLDAAFGSAE